MICWDLSYFHSKYFTLSLVISSLTHGLLIGVLFNLQIGSSRLMGFSFSTLKMLLYFLLVCVVSKDIFLVIIFVPLRGTEPPRHPKNLYFNKTLRWFFCILTFEKHWYRPWRVDICHILWISSIFLTLFFYVRNFPHHKYYLQWCGWS